MKLKVASLLFCCICIFGNIGAQDYQGPKRHIDKILKNAASFSQYYMNADHEALANAYCKDAKILPPGKDIIAGRATIEKWWIVPEGVKILHHKITPTEIKVIGKHAYDMGYYEGKTRKKDGEEVSWKGKYIIVWKKEDKDWKIYMDMWSRV